VVSLYPLSILLAHHPCPSCFSLEMYRFHGAQPINDRAKKNQTGVEEEALCILVAEFGEGPVPSSFCL
jgi:hypothetical protein